MRSPPFLLILLLIACPASVVAQELETRLVAIVTRMSQLEHKINLLTVYVAKQNSTVAATTDRSLTTLRNNTGIVLKRHDDSIELMGNVLEKMLAEIKVLKENDITFK